MYGKMSGIKQIGTTALKSAALSCILALSLSRCGEEVVSTSAEGLPKLDSVTSPSAEAEDNLSEEVKALAAKAKLEVVTAKLAGCRTTAEDDADSLSDYCKTLLALNPDATDADGNIPAVVIPTDDDTATGEEEEAGDDA